MPRISCAFFLESDQALRDLQLALEDGVLLLDHEEPTILVVELGLPPWLLRRESALATRTDLLTPRRQMRAVDRLLAEQRLERSALSGRERSVGGLEQAELL